jgi:hypothetical protein
MNGESSVPLNTELSEALAKWRAYEDRHPMYRDERLHARRTLAEALNRMFKSSDEERIKAIEVLLTYL